MNGRDLTLGVVGALAVAGVLSARRGSASVVAVLPQPSPPAPRPAFLEDFNAATVPAPFSRDGRMFPGVPVSIDLSHMEGDNYVTLDRFEAQPGIRGTGAGTEAMRRLLDLTDKHLLIVYLQPAPLDAGWAKKRLTDWYSSFGFDFEEGSEYGDMLRLPQAKGARRPNPRRSDPRISYNRSPR